MLSHILVNVSDVARSERFYLSALAPLGFFRADGREGDHALITDDRRTVLVLIAVKNLVRNIPPSQRGAGLGHVALMVDSRADVERMERHLASVSLSVSRSRSLPVPASASAKAEGRSRREAYRLSFEDPDGMTIEIACREPEQLAPLHA